MAFYVKENNRHNFTFAILQAKEELAFGFLF